MDVMDEATFLAKVNRLRPRLERLTRRIAGRDYEDAIQNTLLKAWLGFPNFRGEADFDTWILRIAINASISIWKKRHRKIEANSISLTTTGNDGRGFASDLLPSREESQLDVLLHTERDRIAKNAFSQLKPHHRRVLQLADDGYKIREISKILCIPYGAVKSRIYRARLELCTKAKRQSASPKAGSNGICRVPNTTPPATDEALSKAPRPPDLKIQPKLCGEQKRTQRTGKLQLV